MKWEVWYDVKPMFLPFKSLSPNLVVKELYHHEVRYFAVTWTSSASGELSSDVSNAQGVELSLGILVGSLQKIDVYIDNVFEESVTKFPNYLSYTLNGIKSTLKLRVFPTGSSGTLIISRSTKFLGEGFTFEVNPESVSILPYEANITQRPTTSEPSITVGGKTYPSISFKGIISSEEQAKNFYRWTRESSSVISRLFTDKSIYDGLLTKFTGTRTQKSLPSYYVEFEAEFLVTSVISGVEVSVTSE